MVYGSGKQDGFLSEAEVRGLCAEALASRPLDGRRLLVIIPDLTRTAPIDLMFRVLYDLLAPRVELLDCLIALGTHPPMTDEAINQRVGITAEERRSRYSKVRFFNHRWDDPLQLTRLGVLGESEVFDLSTGMLAQPVEVTINKMVFDYDLVVIVGPTFPHEVMGFSGGNKYLFPGVAGQAIIDLFHWLGALITSPVVIGTKDTPVRRIVDRAASMLPVERLCFSLVVHQNCLTGLYIGSPEEAFSAAADLSDKLHVIYRKTPCRKVLSCAPLMYDELWTGGKCMYKLEPVVEDGGELIIYAPHIRRISLVHGAIIERIGYHVRDYFLRQMEKFADCPGGVLAHSTHVKGVGTFEGGIETPRIQVTLATGIPEETCRRVNLGYRDPDTIRLKEWQERDDDGILCVAKAGEMLYRLADDPWRPLTADR
jgi:lactate racemase